MKYKYNISYTYHMSYFTNQTIEGSVSIDMQEYSHPIVSDAVLLFHNFQTELNPLDYPFGILEITFSKNKQLNDEIIHNLPEIERIEIIIKNGLIYDISDNLWKSSMIELEFNTEEKHTYHIRSLEIYDEDVEAVIYGKVVGVTDDDPQHNQELYTVYQLPDLIDTINNTIEPVDLLKYMYLQKTYEILFELIEYEKEPIHESYIEKIKAFFTKMGLYINEYNLLEDTFMNQMCNDIIVTMKTIGINIQ